MFSDVIKQLRHEALKTTATNAELLAEWNADMRIARPADKSLPNSVEKVGIVTFLTGLAGIAATANVYHSVLMGTATATEQALIGLGAVEAGEVMVPVVGLVAFGAAAVGAATLAIGQVMAAMEKEVSMEDEKHLRFNAIMNGDGYSGELGAKNWALGAAKMVSDMIHARFGAGREIEDRGVSIVSAGSYSGRVLDVKDGVVRLKTGLSDDQFVNLDASKLSAGVKQSDIVRIRFRPDGVGEVSRPGRGIGDVSMQR